MIKNMNKISISNLLAIGVTVSAQASLTVHLPFDGNFDDVAGGHTVTHIDGAAGSISYVSGTLGDALRFSNPTSTAEGVDILGIDYTMTDEGGISLWYTAEAFYNYNSIFSNSVNADDWEMWVYGRAEARARIEGDSFVSKTDLVQDQTYHIAWTWDRDDADPTQTTVALYFDGALVQTDTGSWVTPGDTVFLGGGTANHGANAIFDDFRIYDHTLSATEVMTLATIPEPSGLTLLAVCSLAFVAKRRR